MLSETCLDQVLENWQFKDGKAAADQRFAGMGLHFAKNHCVIKTDAAGKVTKSYPPFTVDELKANLQQRLEGHEALRAQLDGSLPNARSVLDYPADSAALGALGLTTAYFALTPDRANLLVKIAMAGGKAPLLAMELDEHGRLNVMGTKRVCLLASLCVHTPKQLAAMDAGRLAEPAPLVTELPPMGSVQVVGLVEGVPSAEEQAMIARRVWRELGMPTFLHIDHRLLVGLLRRAYSPAHAVEVTDGSQAAVIAAAANAVIVLSLPAVIMLYTAVASPDHDKEAQALWRVLGKSDIDAGTLTVHWDILLTKFKEMADEEAVASWATQATQLFDKHTAHFSQHFPKDLPPNEVFTSLLREPSSEWAKLNVPTVKRVLGPTKGLVSLMHRAMGGTGDHTTEDEGMDLFE
eukprot:5608651-Prymnesium_polylepis.1